MKVLAFLATKKGIALIAVAAFLVLRGRKARAAGPAEAVQRDDGRLSVAVSSYYDELVGGKRFCYEEGIDANDEPFNRAVSCEEADGYGTVGTYRVRSG